VSTVVVTAVFTPRPGALDALVQALSAAIPAVHEERGCLLYAIHHSPTGQVVMLENWESAELLDAHAAGDAVAALDASIKDLIAEPVLVTRLQPIPAGTASQGAL
jgi:quinol monooxygenase YgiN